MDTRMGVEMELKVVKKDLEFASANSNTKVVDMVSPAPPYAPPAKFKYEWYQTTSLVVVCILAKAAEEENLKVHFSEHILGMVINLREPLPCMLQLPLFGKVNHPPPIQYTTIQNKGSENWAKKYNALEARICELEEKMNAMTLELKEDIASDANDETLLASVESSSYPFDIASKGAQWPKRGDLDMNQHVNNVKYVGWVMESVPVAVFENYELSSMTLKYRTQCSQSDALLSMCSPTSCTAKLEKEAEVEVNGAGCSYTAGSQTSIPDVAKCVPPHLQFTHLLRLQVDGAEILQGKTQWRLKKSKHLH
ncbi:unnamed protein product [Sphagnum troendelagicum]